MRKLCLALAVAAILVAIPGNASTFVALPEDELVGGAEAIVQGKVVNQSSFWSESGRIIVTEATVRVRVGDFRVEAPGFPSFNPGERVILFLSRAEDGTRRVHGYQQGHFEVVVRRDGVRLAVPRIEEGTRLVTRDGRVLPEPRSLPLNEFKRSVRRIAAETGGPRR